MRLYVPLRLHQPDRDVLVALHVADVVGQDGAHRVAVVRLSYRPEPLLTSSVPQLKLHPGPTSDVDQPCEEVDPDCRVGHFREFAIREVSQEGAFSNSAVSNQNQPKLEIS